MDTDSPCTEKKCIDTYIHYIIYPRILKVAYTALYLWAFNHQMRDRPPYRELRPLLFSKSVWVLLYVPQNYLSRAGRQDLRFIVLIREDWEVSAICRCYYKGSTFSSMILRPWVLVWPGFGTFDQGALHDWANRSVDERKHCEKMLATLPNWLPPFF